MTDGDCQAEHNDLQLYFCVHVIIEKSFLDVFTDNITFYVMIVLESIEVNVRTIQSTLHYSNFQGKSKKVRVIN